MQVATQHRYAVQLVTSPRQVAMPAHGVVIAESRHGPLFHGEPREPYVKFHLTLAGEAEWQVDGARHLVSPDMLVFVAPSVPQVQRDRPGRPVSLYFVHARAELLPTTIAQALQAIGMLPIALGDQPGAVRRQVHAWFQELNYEQDVQQPGWQAVQVARVLDLAALILRLAERTSVTTVTLGEGAVDSQQRIAAYVRHQDSHFYLRETLADAARAVHLSPRRFTEVFRTLTGETWNQRLLRLRLDHAERLLRESNRSITGIAFASGFDDLSHFNHLFKRRHCLTPSGFRERHGRIPQA